MAKYDALETHLRSFPGDTVRLTFSEINELIAPEELPLPLTRTRSST